MHRILPFSKSYPEIESTWPTAKCRGRKSFDTWYYIVTCTMLCVSFSSKLKAINVFPKYILKSKARDQSVQARKKLFWLVKVFEQNRKHVEARNQRTGTVIDYFFLYPPILSGPNIRVHASTRASGNGCHWSIAGTVVH